MTEATPRLQLGQTVPDFKLEYYDPATQDFGSTSLGDFMKAGKWTILFFYPADFTFV
jgi:peroxiredoxin (alkyl hydroperoxide reductase subunit C)